MSCQEIRRDPIEPASGVWRFVCAGDPTTGTGFSAGVGSYMQRNDVDGQGYTYTKTGTGNTDWTQLTPAQPNLVAGLPDIRLRNPADIAFKLTAALQ